MGVRSGPRIPSESREEGGQLLIHGNVGDGQVFVDSSPSHHAITTSGNTTHSTTQSKFDGGSVYFDGTGDYLTIADHADWTFGTGDFTIDLWIYPTTIGSGGNKNYVGANPNQHITFASNNSGGLLFYIGNGSWISVPAATSNVVVNSAWQHVAVSRSGGTVYLFHNGVLITSRSQSDSIDTPNIEIGAYGGGASDLFVGYMDEVRITKGTALWTTSFKPPSRRYATRDLVLSLDSTGGYKTGPELLTSGTSGQRAATYGYHQSGDIFDNATMTGFHAKHASSGQANAGGPVTLPLVLGKTYRVRFDCNIISGTGSGRPNFNMSRHYNYGSMTGDKVNRYRVQEGADPYYTSSAVQGKNEFIVTVTTDPTWGNSCIQFSTFGAQEYTISNMSVKELFPYNDLSSGGNTGAPAADAILAVEGYVSATVWPDPATPRHVWDFDGTGDYVDLGSVVMGEVNSAATFCAWVSPSTTSGTPQDGIVGEYVNGFIFSTSVAAYGDIKLYDGTTNHISSGGFVLGNVWNHCVITWAKSDRCHMYHNGQEVYNAAVSATSFGNSPTNTRIGSIGGDYGGSSYLMNGKIATVQLYKAKLTHAQIKDSYNSQRSRFGL